MKPMRLCLIPAGPHAGHIECEFSGDPTPVAKGQFFGNDSFKQVHAQAVISLPDTGDFVQRLTGDSITLKKVVQFRPGRNIIQYYETTKT